MNKTRVTRRSLTFIAVAALSGLVSLADRALAQAPTFRLLTFEAGHSGPRLGSTRGSGEQEVVDVHNAILQLIKAQAPGRIRIEFARWRVKAQNAKQCNASAAVGRALQQRGGFGDGEHADTVSSRAP